jgi:glycosyltransferase involved in cell wall biosynthesis
VLVVDPIFRGSRLVDSMLVCRALAERGMEAHLLTREELPGAHYDEMFRGVAHRLHASVGMPPGVWYAKLGRGVIGECVRRARELVGRFGCGGIFFTGWNEFFPRLLGVPGVAACLAAPSMAIDYDPAFWLGADAGEPAGARVKRAAKRWATRCALGRFPGLNFVLHDERIEGSEIPEKIRGRFHYLPDPSPEIEEAPDCRRGPLRLLFPGRQTSRKGLSDLVEALGRPGFPAEIQVRVVGRLAPECEGMRGALEGDARVDWTDGFVAQEAIEEEYRRCDYVVLPYTREFHCSSGVLAAAAAAGRPVVATDHGLVGWRVAKYGLGFSYPSRDVGRLVELLRELPGRNDTGYARLAAGARAFAGATSAAVFREKLIELMRRRGMIPGGAG